ncbi:MAG TPA: hypothetical protein VGO46_00335 [Gemmatimonadaceae bacterium]|nr:hypothetical protein [Gemmatimonadaceae bacterium]
MKRALAVVGGFILWSVLWLCYNQLLLKAGILPSDLSRPLAAPVPLLMLLAGSVVFSLVSGFVVAKVAGVPATMPALALGILLLATGIFFQLKMWNLLPVWYNVLFLLLLIPLTLAGARMHSSRAAS